MLRVRYLVRLSGIDFAEDYWVADIRIQVPFDKAVLIGRKFHEGFNSAEERVAFGRRVSELYSRPAFPTEISAHIVESLRRWFNKSDKRVTAIRAAGVIGFRLRVAGDGPFDAQLMVVLAQSTNADAAMQALQPWFVNVTSKCEAARINLLEPMYTSLGMVTAETYLTFNPIALEYLTQFVEQ